eukprot:SM000050S17015  [mRNA]  locus=s50:406082:412127:+ [translate_table: standard]
MPDPRDLATPSDGALRRSPAGTPSQSATPGVSSRQPLRGDLGSGGARRPPPRVHRPIPPTPASDDGFDAGYESSQGGAGEDETRPSQHVPQVYVWGTEVRVDDVTRRLRRFFLHFRNDEDTDAGGGSSLLGKYDRLLDEVVASGGSAINVDCREVRRHDAELYRLLRRYPTDVIPLADAVATELAFDKSPAFQNHVQVRMFNLGDTVSMRDLNPGDIDALVAVKGMVVRTSAVVPDIREGFFRCLACGFAPDPVLIDRGCIEEPGRCPRPECAAKHAMSLIHNRCKFANKQLVRLQETPDDIPEGETPHTVSVCAFDALVDAAKPGDRVEVTGVFRAAPVRVASHQRSCNSLYKVGGDSHATRLLLRLSLSTFTALSLSLLPHAPSETPPPGPPPVALAPRQTYIDCIHLKKSDHGRMRAEDPLETDRDSDAYAPFAEGNALSGEAEAKASPWPTCRHASCVPPLRPPRLLTGPMSPRRQLERLRELSRQPDVYERLARSLAPSIWELDDIKKGLLCQLFGGVAKRLEGGGSFRGDINVLLVGDPGTSKSQLLRYAHGLAPRGVAASGRGSSAVGLTAYVARDPETGEMALESGALVLSDRGLCAIDEFDKMSESARSMLHEVMEQQTVSVAKAGIVATLRARTSVLACANPAGSRYDPRASVIDNIRLPPTLLSRFDLIYLVLDKADEATDRRLARHLAFPNSFVELLLHAGTQAPARQTIDVATLAAYISHARLHVHPVLTDEAAAELVSAYTHMRNLGQGRKTITATPRQLESLIRVSEALARMRFSELVHKDDVKEAVRLLQVAMQQSATDPTTGTIDMDLITTGVSASERTRRTLITAALLDLVHEKLQAGGPGMRVIQIWEEMRKQASSSVEISQIDVREALGTLAAEGVVTLVGETVRKA